MSSRHAIITRLKTGTIKKVYNREDGIINPTAPYVVIWKESPSVTGSLEKGFEQWRISCHVAEGFIDTLDNYVETEIKSLLHRVNLTIPVSLEVFE